MQKAIVLLHPGDDVKTFTITFVLAITITLTFCTNSYAEILLGEELTAEDVLNMSEEKDEFKTHVSSSIELESSVEVSKTINVPILVELFANIDGFHQRVSAQTGITINLFPAKVFTPKYNEKNNIVAFKLIGGGLCSQQGCFPVATLFANIERFFEIISFEGKIMLVGGNETLVNEIMMQFSLDHNLASWFEYGAHFALTTNVNKRDMLIKGYEHFDSGGLHTKFILDEFWFQFKYSLGKSHPDQYNKLEWIVNDKGEPELVHSLDGEISHLLQEFEVQMGVNF